MVDNKELNKLEVGMANELKKWRLRFDSILLGLIIIDEDARIQDANKTFINMGSMRYEDVINKYFGDVICCAKSSGQGCSKCENKANCLMWKSITKAYESGNTQTDIRIPFETKKNGEFSHRYLKVTIIPIIDIDNSSFLMELEDVTEQTLKNKIILEERDFYFSVFENYPALVCYFDIVKGVNYFNSKWFQFTGISKDKSIIDELKNSIHPEDLKL